jgi:hypothetical protein
MEDLHTGLAAHRTSRIFYRGAKRVLPLPDRAGSARVRQQATHLRPRRTRPRTTPGHHRTDLVGRRPRRTLRRSVVYRSPCDARQILSVGQARNPAALETGERGQHHRGGGERSRRHGAAGRTCALSTRRRRLRQLRCRPPGSDCGLRVSHPRRFGKLKAATTGAWLTPPPQLQHLGGRVREGRPEHVRDAWSWASVVSSVSESGETADRFRQALTFHGDSTASTTA